MALRLLWFLLHIEHLINLIEHHNSCALEFLYRRLIVAHDARTVLFLGELHELREREEEEVVSCHNQ